ncbi:MAG: hypothetical protein ACJ71L_15040, partial [Nitrososphaeraceae archaeon]
RYFYLLELDIPKYELQSLMQIHGYVVLFLYYQCLQLMSVLIHHDDITFVSYYMKRGIKRY